MNFKEELALKRKQLAEAEQQKEVIKPIVVKEEMPGLSVKQPIKGKSQERKSNDYRRRTD